MKKVIAVFDGKHFSEGAFDFLRRMNEQSPILAIGVFLPAIDYAELLYSIGGLSGPIYYKEVDTTETGISQNNVDRFKELCAKHGIEYRVHLDLEKHVISEVKTESRYADLLIIGSELFYQNMGKQTQGEYLDSTLHKSECPVILLPEQYQFPDNVILAYDGSESSVFAIKQFAYLFPALTNLKTTLVYMGTERSIPDLHYIEELTARHFSDLTINKLEVDPKRYFNTWVQDNGNSLVVAGAFSRSALSEMLRNSFVTETINDHKLPIFIAHK